MEQQQRNPGKEERGTSVAGEEDPGAAVETSKPRPGNEAAPGTPGTGEALCRKCGGSGQMADGTPCPDCGATGRVTMASAAPEA